MSTDPRKVEGASEVGTLGKSVPGEGTAQAKAPSRNTFGIMQGARASQQTSTDGAAGRGEGTSEVREVCMGGRVYVCVCAPVPVCECMCVCVWGGC